MNLVRLHKRVIYFLAVLPFALLLLGGEMNPIVSALFIIGTAVSWFWESPRVDLAKHRGKWTLLTIGATVVMIARFITGGEFRIEPLVDLALLLTVLKLMQRENMGDYAQIMVLSFLLLVAGSVFNPGMIFGIAFVLYLVVGTVGLAVKHLREELTEYHPEQLRSFRVERRFMATVGGLALLVSVFSVAFFILFPRVGFGLFNQLGRPPVSSTGFNERIELGDHGSIRENNTIVMRVELPDVEGRDVDLRLRGTSFNHFNGVRWSQRGDYYDRRNAWVSDGLYSAFSGGWDRSTVHAQDDYSALGRDELPEDTVAQLVYLEPMETELLFGLPQAIAVAYPDEDPAMADTFYHRHTEITRSGDIRLTRGTSTGVRYLIYSRAEAAPRGTLYDGYTDFNESVERFHGVSPPARQVKFADSYLQLPDRLTTRFYGLATSITQSEATPLARARAIERHLRESYDYTTNLPAVDRQNPIESFLFETRRGHCEYFSTAMVLLARAAGLPARNVNGYLGGDWNPVGDYFEVRQSHAHSWVEVFLPDTGWTTFDPTPAEGIPEIAGDSLWTTFMAFFDNVRMLWYRHVIDFDLSSQVAAAKGVVDAFGGNSETLVVDLRELGFLLFWNLEAAFSVVLIWFVGSVFYIRRRRERRWTAADTVVGIALTGFSAVPILLWWRPRGSLVPLIGAVVGSVLIVSVAWINRKRPVRPVSKKRRQYRLSAASKAFMRLVRAHKRAGFEYEIGDTPSRLVEQVEAKGMPHAPQLSHVIGLYQRCRFSGRELPKLVRELKREVRHMVRQTDFEAQATNR